MSPIWVLNLYAAGQGISCGHHMDPEGGHGW